MSRISQRSNAGYYSVAPRIQPAGKWDLLPGGHRILGANVIGYDDSQTASGKWIGEFWYQWPWSAAGTGCAAVPIKAQIDQAKSLGANTIRFFGSQSVRSGSGSPYTNTLSSSDYLARWNQLLSYCRSQGLYVIPTLGSDSSQEEGGGGYTYTPTLSWFQSEYALVCRFLRKYRDIIPVIDIANESYTWTNTSGQGLALYNACKAEAPDLLFSYSISFAHAPGTAPVAGATPPAGSYDVLQFHIYYDMGASDLDSYMSFYGVPVFIGEFGQNMAAGTTARQSRYNAVKAAVNTVTSGRQLAGAVAWNVYDQSAASGDQWGLCNSSGVVRSDVPSIFTSFPS